MPDRDAYAQARADRQAVLREDLTTWFMTDMLGEWKHDDDALRTKQEALCGTCGCKGNCTI